MVCAHPLDKRCQIIQNIGGIRIWDVERCLICNTVFVTLDDVKEVQKHLKGSEEVIDYGVRQGVQRIMELHRAICKILGIEYTSDKTIRYAKLCKKHEVTGRASSQD